MDCEFAGKVSLLVDDELSSDEIKMMRNHLAECSECQTLEKDFLMFRQQIKETFRHSDFVFPESLTEKKIPFWRKGVAVPTPVFVGLLMILIGFGIWFYIPKSEPMAKDTQPSISPGSVSLAKYDKGGRAEIYVVQKDSK